MLIRLVEPRCVAVGLGVHHDRSDTQFAAGARDSERDLPTIGNQDPTKHPRHLDSADLGTRESITEGLSV